MNNGRVKVGVEHGQQIRKVQQQTEANDRPSGLWKYRHSVSAASIFPMGHRDAVQTVLRNESRLVYFAFQSCCFGNRAQHFVDELCRSMTNQP